MQFRDFGSVLLPTYKNPYVILRLPQRSQPVVSLKGPTSQIYLICIILLQETTSCEQCEL